MVGDVIQIGIEIINTILVQVLRSYEVETSIRLDLLQKSFDVCCMILDGLYPVHGPEVGRTTWDSSVARGFLVRVRVRVCVCVCVFDSKGESGILFFIRN